MKPGYSLVIATMDRADRLRDALESVARQTYPPERVIVVDASQGEETEHVADEFYARLPIEFQRATEPGAAHQRNQGAERISSELIAFIDDDVVLADDLFAKCCAAFSDPATGGVAARMNGASHPRPRGLLWWYYRLQAGYVDATYGARLFGPAINHFPCYDAQPGTLIAAEWLNSGCVLFHTELFRREKFPAFEGYSHMEDVHLSARIGRTHRLYFHAEARYDHFPLESHAKGNRRRLGQMRMRNQALVAREVLGLGGWELRWKMALHRLFTSVFLLRFRPSGWRGELAGIWS